MELNDITTLARKLLDTTHHLFAGSNNPKSSFAKAVEGTFRRDYLTLSTMLILAEHDKPEVRIASETDCMNLCRRVLEDFISLEYMLLEGKEAEAEKFFNYYHVEAKRDMDLAEAAGITIDQQVRKISVENYDRVKGKFLDSSSKTRTGDTPHLERLLLYYLRLVLRTVTGCYHLVAAVYSCLALRPRCNSKKTRSP